MEKQLSMTSAETEAVFNVLEEELDGNAKMEAFINGIHTEDIVKIISEKITELESTDLDHDDELAAVLRDANTNMMAHEGML